MGVPVINFTESYSYASQHPVQATLVVVAIVAGGWFIGRLIRKHPRQAGKIRWALFAAYLGLAVAVNWSMFKPHPSIASQMLKFVESAQQHVEHDQLGSSHEAD